MPGRFPLVAVPLLGDSFCEDAYCGTNPPIIFVPVPAGTNWRKVSMASGLVKSAATFCSAAQEAFTPGCAGGAFTLAPTFNGSFNLASSTIAAVGPVTPRNTSNNSVCGAGPGTSIQFFVTVRLTNGNYETLGGVFLTMGDQGRSSTSSSCFGFPYSDTRAWTHGRAFIQDLSPIPVTLALPF